MSKRKYEFKDWIAVKDILSQGVTIRAAASKTGVSRSTVWRWNRRDSPPKGLFMNMKINLEAATVSLSKKKSSSRLTYNDRVIIFVMHIDGKKPGEIAKKIGVHRTTVFRELARMPKGHYDPREADYLAHKKTKRPKKRKLDTNLKLREVVVQMLTEKMSPEQIAHRLVMEYPKDEEMRVSHETIYQAIYIQGKGSLRQEIALEKALRSGKTKRKPASKLPPRPRGKSWVEGCEISTRPPEVADRAVPGHWEGDLIIGSDMSSCLVTLVERKTRFLVARRFSCHDTGTIVDSLIEMAGKVPEGLQKALCKSLTWDQGCELADAARFVRATGFKVYFCDPHSPWQKGTNENTNGLIRQYFPKGTNFSKVTDEEVRLMQDQMNSRPRKTLNWLTPAEVLADELAKSVQ